MLKPLTSRLDALYLDVEERRSVQAFSLSLLAMIAGLLMFIPLLIAAAGQGQGLGWATLGLVGAAGVLTVSGWLLYTGKASLARPIMLYGMLAALFIGALLPVGIVSGIPVALLLIYLSFSLPAAKPNGRLPLLLAYLLALVVAAFVQGGGGGPSPAAETGLLTLNGVAVGLGMLLPGLLIPLIVQRMEEPVQSQEEDAAVLNAILTISRLASANMHLDSMASNIVRQIASRLGYSRVLMHLLSEDGQSAMLYSNATSATRTRVPVLLGSAIRGAMANKPVLFDRGTTMAGDLLPGMLSGLSVPLVVDGRVRGVLGVQSPASEAFDEDDINRLQMMADHLAPSVFNAQAFGSEAAILETASPILQAVRELAVAVGPEDVIATLRTYISPGVDYASMVARRGFDDTSGELEVITEWSRENLLGQIGTLPDLFGLIGNHVLVADDLSGSSVPHPFRDALGGMPELVSAGCFPMATRDSVIGYLLVGSRQREAFDEKAAGDLEIYAHQAAVTVANLVLLHRLNTSLREASTLYSTSLALNAAQNMGEIFDIVLSEIADLATAERTSVYLAGPDPHTEVAYVENVARMDSGILTILQQPDRYDLASAPIISIYPQSRANMVFNHIAGDERIGEGQRGAFIQRGINAAALVPIVTGTTWLGALLLESREAQAFTDDLIQRARNIADVAALSIDLQILLENTRQAYAREHDIREVVDAIRLAITPDDVLNAADEGLSRLLHYPIETIQQARLGERSLLTPSEWQIVLDVDRQAQLTISNLNLLEQTQLAVAQEQILGEISTDLQRVVEVDEVMQTTVQTLQSMFTGYDVRVRLTPPEEKPLEDMETGQGT
nr:GAF domain-containing protein [Anaerolineae bacterium]